jgi:hypothetical protein
MSGTFNLHCDGIRVSLSAGQVTISLMLGGQALAVWGPTTLTENIDVTLSKLDVNLPVEVH